MRLSVSVLIWQFATVATALAQFELGVVDLGNLGGGRWGADISIWLARGEHFVGGAIVGHTNEGVRLVRGTDPNSGETVFTAPETAGVGRDVTFVNRPRPQFSAERFGEDGVPFLIGSYDPPTLNPVLTDGEINIAFMEYPFVPSNGSVQFYQRVVIDTSGTPYAGALVYPSRRPLAPGHVSLGRFESIMNFGQGFSPDPSIVWSFFAVPEPPVILLIAAGVVVAVRWRH